MDQIITYEEGGDKWFCFCEKSIPKRVGENLPLWYCIDACGFLRKISDDPLSVRALVAILRKKSHINIINETTDLTSNFFNSDFKVIYSRDNRLLSWDKNGDVNHAISGDYYFEYSNEICIRVKDLILEDELEVIKEGEILCKLVFDLYYINVAIKDGIPDKDFCKRLEPYELERLNKILYVAPIPTFHLQKRRFFARNFSTLQRCFVVRYKNSERGLAIINNNVEIIY